MPVYSHQHKWMPGPYIPAEMASFAISPERKLPNPASVLIVCTVCALVIRVHVPKEMSENPPPSWAEATEVSDQSV